MFGPVIDSGNRYGPELGVLAAVAAPARRHEVVAGVRSALTERDDVIHRRLLGRAAVGTPMVIAVEDGLPDCGLDASFGAGSSVLSVDGALDRVAVLRLTSIPTDPAFRPQPPPGLRELIPIFRLAAGATEFEVLLVEPMLFRQPRLVDRAKAALRRDLSSPNVVAMLLVVPAIVDSLTVPANPLKAVGSSSMTVEARTRKPPSAIGAELPLALRVNQSRKREPATQRRARLHIRSFATTSVHGRWSRATSRTVRLREL